MIEMEKYVYVEKIYWKRLCSPECKQKIKDNLLEDLLETCEDNDMELDITTVSWREEINNARKCNENYKITITGRAIRI